MHSACPFKIGTHCIEKAHAGKPFPRKKTCYIWGSYQSFPFITEQLNTLTHFPFSSDADLQSFSEEHSPFNGSLVHTCKHPDL